MRVFTLNILAVIIRGVDGSAPSHPSAGGETYTFIYIRMYLYINNNEFYVDNNNFSTRHIEEWMKGTCLVIID